MVSRFTIAVAAALAAFAGQAASAQGRGVEGVCQLWHRVPTGGAIAAR
ncbi:MAG: hypothetical protein J0J06_16480 [Sphingomonas sp.]|nr:hypothetical protein [Sphingomonas sp.]MBN8817031.1 hypothetical protein [Sphingomonas sp.]